MSLTIAVAGMSLLGAGIASAETYIVKGGENSIVNTTELTEAVEKCNAAASASTIQLGSGSYLPAKPIVFTNTTAPCTIEGPAGSPTTRGKEADISGASIETPGVELLTAETSVSLTLKNVSIVAGGGEGAPAIEVGGAEQKPPTPGATVTVENSLLANTGSSVVVQQGGTLTVRNSTISDGRAEGVVNLGKASFFNTTVAYNKSTGIEDFGEETSLTNSIVAENHSDCGTAVTTSVHSLDSDGTCGVGALTKLNPKLNPSAANDGGTTQVHSVLPGSPAINAGEKTACLTEDQRHAPRPGIAGDACTIGADEYSNTPPKVTVPANISKTTETAEQTSLVVTYEASAVGVNDRVTSFSCSPASGSSFIVGTTTVKCTAVDGHENTATGEFTVTITQKKEEGLKEGHPQAFSNAIKVGPGSANAIGEIGYGDIDLESSALSSTLECSGEGLASGFNGGSPIRALGQILSFTGGGHVPNEKGTAPELSAQCRGLAGAWVTDETPIAKESRGEITTPWNAEAECGTREKAKVTIIKIGVPTSRTSAQVKAAEERGCDTEAVEATETTNELSKKEGCYQSNPSPAGCINVLIVDPAAAVEVEYGGTLRVKAINGAGNGLDQTKLEFEGAKSGELQCEHPVTCSAKATTLGAIKDQGYEAAQLINYK